MAPGGLVLLPDTPDGQDSLFHGDVARCPCGAFGHPYLGKDSSEIHIDMAVTVHKL